jgi:hypothetical protein
MKNLLCVGRRGEGHDERVGIGRRACGCWAPLGGGLAGAALGDSGHVGGGRALGGVGRRWACGWPALSGAVGVWARRRLACDSNRATGGRFRDLYFRRPG